MSIRQFSRVFPLISVCQPSRTIFSFLFSFSFLGRYRLISPLPELTGVPISRVPSIPSTDLASLQHYAMNPDVARSHGPRGPFGKPCLLCEYIYFDSEVSLGEVKVASL